MQVMWSPKAIKQMKRIGDRKLRQRIADKVDALELVDHIDACAAAIKLTNHAYDYRMRIGDWRILIDLIDAELVIIRIEEVKKRDERTY